MTLAVVAGPAKVGISTDTSGTGTGTTASATYSANARLLVLLGSNGPSGFPISQITGIAGTTGLSWLKVVQNSTATGGGYPRSEIWTAVVGASSVTGTVAVSIGGGASGSFALGDNATFAVLSLTDTSTPIVGVTATATNASGLPSVAMSGLTAGSFVFAAVGDWAAAGTSATETPGTGQTAIADGWVSGQYGAHIWRTTIAIASTTQTMSLTAPAAENYNMVAAEIKTNSSAAAVTRFRRIGKTT